MALLSTLPPPLQTDPRAARPTGLDAPVPLRFWHLASFDAPTVAVVWTFGFAWVCNARLSIWLPAVLALSAWSFYIADRLLDARNANTPLRARHHFHWKHRRIFAPLAAVAAIVAIVLVLHSMPFAARERNSVLAAAALAYFTSVHSPWRVAAPKFRFPKELLVGTLFTLACAAPTLNRIAGHRLTLLPAILIFATLAWLNCHAIESWESDSRRRLAVLGPAIGLAVAASLASFTLSRHDSRQAALLAAAALSAIFLALLDRRRQRLSPITLRASADLVLLTPLLVLVVR